MNDTIITGLLLSGNARLISVSGKNLVEQLRQTHMSAPICTAALGRTAMSALLLASMQKADNESVSVIIKGGGETGNIVCVAKKDGIVKGYIENPFVDRPLNNGKLDVGGAVGKDGTITVVRDMSRGEPYIGKVELVSGEIAEDTAAYLMQSEQKESLCYLGVHVERDGSVISAGGIIIQPLPDCPDDDIKRIAAGVDAVSLFTIMLESEMSHQKILSMLLEKLEPEFLEETDCRYECDCSRERLENALSCLSKNELVDMIEKDGGAEAKCSFCNKVYNFNQAELMDIIGKIGGADGK